MLKNSCGFSTKCVKRRELPAGRSVTRREVFVPDVVFVLPVTFFSLLNVRSIGFANECQGLRVSGQFFAVPSLRGILLACLLVMVAGVLPGRAQAVDAPSTVTKAVEILQKQVKDDLDKAAKSLDELNKQVETDAKADNKLATLKLNADLIGKGIDDAMANLENRYNLVSKRLQEIGDAPADGKAPEDQAISADRKRLQDEKVQMNTILSDGDALKTEAGRIANQITDLRRELFSEMLFRRTDITAESFQAAHDASIQKWGELKVMTSGAMDFMWKFKRPSLGVVLALSLLAALFFVTLFRRAFSSLIHRDVELENPSYIHRLSLAFWSAVIPSAGGFFFVFTVLVLVRYFNVLRIDIVEIFQATIWVILGVYFVWKLARAIVAPGKPQWRLVSVSDRGSKILVIYAVILAALNGLSYISRQTNVTLDSPVVLTAAQGFFSSINIGVVLLCLSFVRPMRRDGEVASDGRWPLPIRFLLVLGGAGLIIAALAGYIGLAQFVATQIVVTSAILVTAYVGFLTGHAISKPQAFGKTAAGLWLAKRYGLSAIRIDQLGLIIGMLVDVVVAILCFPVILLQWGFRSADILGFAIRIFTGFTVGNITISVVGIVSGIAVFFVGLFATRWLQRWLDRNVMARSQTDPGVRNSVNTFMGYFGIAIAAIIGVSAAGIDLSSLAFVAGALSLGIGFGLQTIVSNFVSGLILLAERPFKVGDWVVAGTVEGFVRRIAVRATEIETFQSQSIIVPNSQLINASVGNWTLHNKFGRNEITVGVAYDSDPRQVMDIMLDIAKSHPSVLAAPEPTIAFMGFGVSSLDFELRYYLADLLTGLGVRNDIRIAIVERFREAKIEIPYPKRDVKIHFADDAGTMRMEEMPKVLSDQLKAEADKRRKAMEEGARDMDAMDAGQHASLHQIDDAPDEQQT